MLLDWLDTHSFAYIGPIGVFTHNQGNILDLAFSFGPLSVYTTLARYLDTTSDHAFLLTIVCWDSRLKELTKYLRLNTLDPDVFTNTL